MNNLYPIIKEGENKYIFFTKNNIEYQLVVKKSGITYQTRDGIFKNVLELALNCDVNTAIKDMKTLKTLVFFFAEISDRHEAIYMQIHNQHEKINNDKTERRGLSRLKLWNRTLSTYFENFILLNNLILSPNKKSDILSIIIKKSSPDYNQIVTSFYRFCHIKMYKKN